MLENIIVTLLCSVIIGLAGIAYWRPLVYRRMYKHLMLVLGYCVSLALAFNFGVSTVANTFSQTWDENMWGTFAFGVESFGFSYESILLFSGIVWVYLSALLFVHHFMDYMGNGEREG